MRELLAHGLREGSSASFFIISDLLTRQRVIPISSVYNEQMMTKNFLQRLFMPTESDDLEDIRHDIISSIVALMVFAAWLNLWASLHYRQSGFFCASVILIAGALGSAKLRSHHLRISLYIINVTLIGTVCSNRT
jgi:hypothetical protein